MRPKCTRVTIEMYTKWLYLSTQTDDALAPNVMDFYSALHKTGASSLSNNVGDTYITTHTTDPLQERYSKLEKHNSTLQSHNADLKDTVDALTKSFEAAQEKLKLQAQLHAEQLRTLQAKDKTLTERCQSTAALAEQHRLANLKLEQQHKSLQQDLQCMAAVQAQGDSRLASEITRLESSLRSKDQEHGQKSLQLSKRLEAVSGSLQVAKELLRSYPQMPADGIKVLKSSAEVLQLTHSKGGVDSMRDCLGQVSAVLSDLHSDLHTHSRLASEWTQKAARLIA